MSRQVCHVSGAVACGHCPKAARPLVAKGLSLGRGCVFPL